MDMADKGGIESLSMRRVATTLGVEAMSLYHHVANKDDMVDAIVDRVFREIELPPESKPWTAAVRVGALAVHDALLRHPWACSLAMAPPRSRRAPVGRMRYMEWLLRRIAEANLPEDVAFQAYHALDGHILGFTLWQLGHSGVTPAVLADTAAFLRKLPSGEFGQLARHFELHLSRPGAVKKSGFEFGLDLILSGLAMLRRDRR